jgi:hypothetical protein
MNGGWVKKTLELEAERERLKAISDLNRSRSASSSKIIINFPTVSAPLRAWSQWALISRPHFARTLENRIQGSIAAES